VQGVHQEELSFSSSEIREVSQEETLTGLLNNLQAQQSMLEEEVPKGTYIPSRRERDRDTLRLEPQISSEEIAPLRAKDLARGCKVQRNLWRFRV
jgi:hypothetical protein